MTTAAGQVQVTRLTTGVVREKRVKRGPRRYLPGGWAPDTLPVNVFLIEHPGGPTLFDTGQSARAAEPGYIPRWHPFMRLSRFELAPSDEVGAQLRAMGCDPLGVRRIVLSHLHNDHVGCIAPFSNAEILVNRTEWERFHGLGGRIRGYLPQHWPAGVKPTLVELDGPSVGPFARTLDLAGDGSLLLVPLPGHTPGHIGLLARIGESSYLLAADAAHSVGELAESHPQLEAFCRRHDVTLLLSHDGVA